MALILVDVCDGSCYTEYFDEQAECTISWDGESVRIQGNKEYFTLLARQMIYFSCNDFCLPFGAHVHYDEFTHIGCHGIELVLEVIRAQPRDIVLDDSEELCVEVTIPKCIEELYTRQPSGASVRVECNAQSVYILGNADGLIFIATALLFLIENGGNGTDLCCAEGLLAFWNGNAITFALS